MNGVRLEKGARVELQFGDSVEVVPRRDGGGAVLFVLQRVGPAPRALEGALAAAAGAGAPPEAKPVSAPADDDAADDLTCCLCLEVFHQCVSAVPCMHKVG